MHDVIIVGAGIAGLRVGIHILREYRLPNVLILEKYNYVGGRIVTHYKGGNQWEIGAGRISTTHHRVRKLMRKYGLTWAPISTTSEWRSARHSDHYGHPDPFNHLSHIYLDPLRHLPAETLATSTIMELLRSIHGRKEASEFAQYFPYWSELYTMRADMALASFAEEMNPSHKFGVCKEGLSAITKAMREEFLALGGKIHTDREVTAVRQVQGNTEQIRCRDGTTYSARIVILALHSDAVESIASLGRLPVLSHLRMEPLLRMYAVFPTDSRSGTAWFADLPKCITDRRVRYVIPINPAKGTIMISYTDGADAKYWMAMKSAYTAYAVQEAVMRDIRALYPEKTIPDPIEFKLYPWHAGCTYWTPGAYDPHTVSRESLCIRPTVFCCGESFSTRQAWIEGALEHADMLLDDPRFQLMLL
jgi:monoamine oxidase